MPSIKKIRPTWMEINLNHLIENIMEIKRVTDKRTRICGVVKADAYGHGAPLVAKTLAENGVEFLAVATLSEAIQIRQYGVDAPLLILGYTPEDQVEELIRFDIRQSVFSYEQAQVISKTAKKMNSNATLHVKINTGMSRLGFELDGRYDETLADIHKIYELPHITLEGVYSHLATADETDKSFSELQFQRFTTFVKNLEARTGLLPIKHISNSAATVDLPHMNMDMVRVGIIMYGMLTSKYVQKDVLTLKPIAQLKSTVVDVRELQDNVGVSYNHSYRTQGKRRIITIPIGFGDGFPRVLTGKTGVYFQDHKLPIIGNICMDHCMADATGVNVKVGDVVTVYSNGEPEDITIDQVAEKAGTINTEILTSISKRVPRVYIKHNKVINVVDNILDKPV